MQALLTLPAVHHGGSCLLLWGGGKKSVQALNLEPSTSPSAIEPSAGHCPTAVSPCQCWELKFLTHTDWPDSQGTDHITHHPVWKKNLSIEGQVRELTQNFVLEISAEPATVNLNIKQIECPFSLNQCPQMAPLCWPQLAGRASRTDLHFCQHYFRSWAMNIP